MAFDLITGNNYNGPVVYDASKKHIRYLDDYRPNSDWKTVAGPAFDPQGISGDNANGVIAWSKQSVARMDNYRVQDWKEVANPPVPLEGLTGDNADGPAAFAGNDVYYLPSYRDNK